MHQKVQNLKKKVRNHEVKILKKIELVRARVLHSTFMVSGPRTAPPDPNPPTFTPRFSSQALATGGPEHLHTKIFLPSLGHWRPRAQKEKTFAINFAIRHRTSQKTWPKPAQTPSKGSTFSRKNPPKGSPLSPPAERECG